jgi:hypothetical protein
METGQTPPSQSPPAAPQLDAMIRGDTLPRSSEYLDLCGRVVEAIEADSHEQADIEAWSYKLADDLGKFSD